jgi:hypothetical protein
MLYVDLAGVEYRNQQASEAERDAASAIRILEKARGRQNREALMSAYNYLGVSRSQSGKTFAEQDEPMRRALEIGRELYGSAGPTLVNLSVLATTNLKAGHFDEAEKYLSEATAIADARPAKVTNTWPCFATAPGSAWSARTWSAPCIATKLRWISFAHSSTEMIPCLPSISVNGWR